MASSMRWLGFLLILAVAWSAVGCGDDDDDDVDAAGDAGVDAASAGSGGAEAGSGGPVGGSGGAEAGGGGGGAGGGGGDSSSDVVPYGGEECGGPESAPDFVMEPEFQEGSGAFYGTIEFPEALRENEAVMLVLDWGSNPRMGLGNEMMSFRPDRRTKRVTYGVEGLEDDIFHLAAWVTRRSDVPMGASVDEGDWYGFYGGTVEEPAQYKGMEHIEVEGNKLCKVDFGAGPVVCLARYGEACLQDEDCRGTVCAAGGGAVFLRDGACQEEKCVELECEEGTEAREANCIGWD
jgi:hypothetical protein